MNLEYYSSLALVASVVVYAVAMFLHAAEWATARQVAPSLRDSRFATERRGERKRSRLIFRPTKPSFVGRFDGRASPERMSG